MEKEALFAGRLAELKTLAKEQGSFLTEEQVGEAFVGFNLEAEKLDMVRDYLKKNGIGVGEPFDADDNLSGEEKNYLKLYLEEISGLSAVSGEEREAVFLGAIAGKEEAQARLLELLLPQIADMARLYAGQGVLLEDLIGEGNVAAAAGVKRLGEAQAAVREDAQQAAWAERLLAKQIMEAMESYVAENAAESKKDRRIADKVNKVAEAARELAEDYGRKVTVEELAAEGSLSVRAIEEAVRISGGKIEDLEGMDGI
ncbi:MAG: hypothetical protein K2I01_05290 [Lachnospiraceae bacterium]|nr:hypothetical protein [Lachnospiraceae bacterium]